MWFRRDLRLADQPTLLAAAEAAPRGLALFVLDDRLLAPSGSPRRTFLYRCLRELHASLGGRLLVRSGDPADVVPAVAGEIGAGTVHVAADFGPYGRARDERVAAALRDAGRELVRSGSPYAVAPGRVRTSSGDGFRVFTPFHRAWRRHGWRRPAETSVETLDWITPPAGRAVPDDEPGDAVLPAAGESAALAAWREFRHADQGRALGSYAEARDRPDRDGTSRLSVYLKYGCLHPRTLLDDIGRRTGEAAERYRTELAWREFYADVLYHTPGSARQNWNRRFDALPVEEDAEAERRFQAWCDGRTGYPIVDAGMRQLRAEAWMHNRVRMIVASFLVKDLHLPWWWGARHFMRYLVDGDLASNQHGWQWVAGSGTDAAPYVRIFNPTSQGERFDPAGDYVRRYVPELSGIPGKGVHRPWALSEGLPGGYPRPIVDHAAERVDALARYERIRVG